MMILKNYIKILKNITKKNKIFIIKPKKKINKKIKSK